VGVDRRGHHGEAVATMPPSERAPQAVSCAPATTGRTRWRWPWFVAFAVQLIGVPADRDVLQYPHDEVFFAVVAAQAAVILLGLCSVQLAWLGLAGALLVSSSVTEIADQGAAWPWPLTSTVLFLVLTGRGAALGWAARLPAAAIGIAVTLAIPAPALARGTTSWLAVAVALVVLLLVTALGEVQRRRGLAELALREHLRRDGAERARAALAAERLRIARDLHDVVAHHMTSVALQLDVVRMTGTRSADEEDLLLQASRTVRSALQEMRSVVGALRDDDDPLVPTRTLADAPDLVRTVRATGVRVDVTTELGRYADLGDLSRSGAVPKMAELAVYRLLQEGLSNAMQHAPGSAVRIHVSTDPGHLRVSLSTGLGTSSTTARAPDDDTRTGFGLRGAEERFVAVGGTLLSGREGDQFVVRASVPVTG
jgi:signal transduction histidine kinase